VLIAGKGNERTQEIAGRLLAFSDARVARRALDARLAGDAGVARRMSASAAVVLDQHGRPAIAHDAEVPHPPASLVKLMTLRLAFDALARGEVGPGDTVTISRYAASTPHPRLPLRAGDRVRFAMLLQAVCVRSSNTAATAIAEHIAGDEGAFVARMNAAATTLGLGATHFATAHGLPHRHQMTTALDMARLLSHLSREHRAALAMLRRSSFRFRGARYARNITLLRRRGLLALKTGFTWEAGYNLAIASRERGEERHVVVLGAGSRARSFAEAQMLLVVD
jgi:D-alanyl-D-alanine carboxypeptidase